MDNHKVDVFLTHQDDVQACWLRDAQLAANPYNITLSEHWADDAVSQGRQIVQSIWSPASHALVILAKGSNGPTNLLREAATHGKSVVLLNRTISDMDPSTTWSWPTLNRDFPATLMATVVPDALDTGRIQARQFKALLPRGGTILYVLGDPASSDGTERLRGIEEVLAKNKAYTIATAVGGFLDNASENACRRWLRTALLNPNFHLGVVGSQSETMVPGIRRALQACAANNDRSELLRVPLTAVDGTPRYKQEIDRGLLTATVETPSRIAAAVRVLAEFWSTHKKPL